MKNKEYNPLIMPLVAISIVAILYMFAFHSERNKNKVLEEKVIELELKITNLYTDGRKL